MPEGLGLEQREKKSLIMTTISRMQIDSACCDTTQSMAHLLADPVISKLRIANWI
jgi:hypothetical protein